VQMEVYAVANHDVCYDIYINKRDLEFVTGCGAVDPHCLRVLQALVSEEQLLLKEIVRRTGRQQLTADDVLQVLPEMLRDFSKRYSEYKTKADVLTGIDDEYYSGEIDYDEYMVRRHYWDFNDPVEEYLDSVAMGARRLRRLAIAIKIMRWVKGILAPVEQPLSANYVSVFEIARAQTEEVVV